MKPTRKSLVEQFLRERPVAVFTRATLVELHRYVSQGLAGGKVSDRYLLDLVEHSGVAVSRELEGLPPDLRDRVHFHDLASAEGSLRDIHREYLAALTASNRERAEDCRRAVLRGKERLLLVLRRRGLSLEKRAEKEEILGWFRVWLETPELFSSWLDLRKRALL